MDDFIIMLASEAAAEVEVLEEGGGGGGRGRDCGAEIDPPCAKIFVEVVAVEIDLD